MDKFIKVQVEQEVLATMMVEVKAYDSYSDQIILDMFYAERHKELYKCIQVIKSKGFHSDLVAMRDWLFDRELLEKIGGEEYLLKLSTDTVATSWTMDNNLAILKKAMLTRKALDITKNAELELKNNPDLDPMDLINSVAANMINAGIQSNNKTMTGINECFTEWGEDMNNPKQQGIGTGLSDLDDLIGGLDAGNLVILAARPSMGKTALAVNILDHVVTATPKSGLLISLEMPKIDITRRIMAARANVSIGALRMRKLSDEQWERVTPAMSALSQAKLYISDDSNQTVQNVRTLANELKRKHGEIGVIMVDHLGLMGGLTAENRNNAIGEITKQLKILAKECNCAVILLCQLNRGVDQRTEKRPTMSDLRDSGNIEQDADLILMLYRDEYYFKEKSKFKGVAELIVAKQRNGGVGTVYLGWHGQYSKFYTMKNYDPQHGEVE